MIINEAVIIIAVIMALIISLFSYNKNKKQYKHIKKLETRIDNFERCQFTEENKKNLQAINSKINLFLITAEKELPKILKQVNTPKLNLLLDKIIQTGLNNLSPEEHRLFAAELANEYDKALTKEDQGRAITIIAITAILTQKRNQ